MEHKKRKILRSIKIASIANNYFFTKNFKIEKNYLKKQQSIHT